ncbi:hypothetical protein MMAG44476_22087 [Mycolicibacterium mageritense DSM 44476 = CIP 104973]|uniref:Holo-ACP synthase, malonate decarboxylase-specif ic n=1 Tax=Mycolicibacterium canariasense TaxID=228230 RepID=A0A100WAT9_MYCCR|nr:MULTISPECIES: hypothetical protein [Mycolicibacterium]MCC9179499.1 hypothetical protein [Mycolicibacterium mageritense]MCV7211496.1 hypothetical protein [Mycolicibacterium canariasense]ORV10522.1 hypothetical protein AWB94_07440 [Mycolicibacterium canariasense]GAS94842.1 holo-ACP synthase, malonate decarboxylase-specif ic [Mycolicibacterium canariasense]
MSTTYVPLTLGELVAHLRELGDAPVRGLSGNVHSHRAFYDRSATEPTDDVRNGAWLAEAYSAEIDTPLPGYGGGQYRVSADKVVYYARYGHDGPVIIGFERAADGVHELVLLDDRYRL